MKYLYRFHMTTKHEVLNVPKVGGPVAILWATHKGEPWPSRFHCHFSALLYTDCLCSTRKQLVNITVHGH